MISEIRGPVWTGYRSTSGRFDVTHDDLKRGVAILGQGSSDLATLLAYACDDAGLRTLVLDMSGQASTKLSGYIPTFQLPHFLYDALTIGEEASAGLHGELAGSAYSCSLDLSFEQEGILNTAMQIVAAERGVASPAAVGDLIVEKSDKFRGRPADRLVARLASLSSLNMTGEEGVVAKMLEGSAVLNFRAAGHPEAVETAATLLIAKLLALLDEGGRKLPDVVIMPSAGHLFRVRPMFRRTEKLLTSFVASPMPKVLASESAYGLDENFQKTGFIKILSSAVWNEGSRREEVLLPNMFMVRNHPYGHDVAFVPREFEPRSSEAAEPNPESGGPHPPPDESPDLIAEMLQDIDSYEAPSRQSVIAFLSQAYEARLVERTLDRLQSEGFVAAVEKDLKSGRKMSVLALTEKGRSLMELSR